MSAIAVVPVKQFARAKQRLSDDGFRVSRRALVESMVTDVLQALKRAETIELVIVVTQDHDVERLALAWDAEVVHDPDEDSHSAAAMLGVAEARRRGAKSVLLVAGDCPMLNPAEVDALVSRREGLDGVIVVPDRHGTGTNALMLTPPDAIAPAFGPGSCERHVALASAAGVPVEVDPLPSLAIDVDTREDLDVLRNALAAQTGNAAHTRGMLARL